jgi:hypothetical protein
LTSCNTVNFSIWTLLHGVSNYAKHSFSQEAKTIEKMIFQQFKKIINKSIYIYIQRGRDSSVGIAAELYTADDHSPPSTAEVKQEKGYTTTHRWAFETVMGYLYLHIRGGIQNTPYWCRHLYSSCSSVKHLSQHAKL